MFEKHTRNLNPLPPVYGLQASENIDNYGWHLSYTRKLSEDWMISWMFYLMADPAPVPEISFGSTNDPLTIPVLWNNPRGGYDFFEVIGKLSSYLFFPNFCLCTLGTANMNCPLL